MSTDLNVIAINGRLTKDADCRVTQDGKNSVRFSIASNVAKKAADGSWADEGNFFDCLYYGHSGINQYLTKGRQLSIAGSLRQIRWETNGQKYSKVCIVANQISLVGSRSDQGGETCHPKPQAQAQAVSCAPEKTEEQKLEEANRQYDAYERNRRQAQAGRTAHPDLEKGQQELPLSQGNDNDYGNIPF